MLVTLKQVYETAAAAKSTQLCPTLRDPIDGSPAGSAVPGKLNIVKCKLYPNKVDFTI